MLVDQAEVTIQAGKGGDGKIAWRREKFVPRGGPDGGDGGRGGSVFVHVSHNQDTLNSYRIKKVYAAENGENGRSKRQSGKAGKDLTLEVPVGTVITDLSSGELIVDCDRDGSLFRLAKGGRGGLGNIHFSTSTVQAPHYSKPGLPGEKRSLQLELRVIADIGLVGLPNAGKSSLLKLLTGKQSRIAPFPFSTVEPILGTLAQNRRHIVIVDLPGLIEGAHKGKGLGDKFLKHLSRVKVIAHLLAADEASLQQYEQIRNEMRRFDEKLTEVAHLTIITKSDLLTSERKKILSKELPGALFMSNLTGDGSDKVLCELVGMLDRATKVL